MTAKVAIRWAAVATTLAVVGHGSFATAQEAAFDPLLAELGAPVFERSCASCHGSTGLGDGPVARVLHPAPADLTRISERRGGVFPGGEIARYVDGRFDVPAHGSRAMPVWGERFASDIPDPGLGESIARGQIATVIEYLKSIQRPANSLPPDAASSPAEEHAEQTRQIMREVFGAIQRLLPASFDERRFADESLQPELRAALGTLARNAGALARHGSQDNESFAFLSRTLARDANEIERRFVDGRYEESRFLLHELTEDCIACHSRLPDPGDAPLSAGFVDTVEVRSLPLPEQARLAMAARQFDRALASFEAMFASSEFDAGSIDLLGELDDYLDVCLNVKGDFERPARTFAKFMDRDDLRPALRETLETWLDDLASLGARAPIEGFEAGRDLVKAAEAESEGRENRALHVRYHAAAGTLHRHLETLPAADRRAAESYYWLGVIGARVGRSLWLSETEPLLEAAIRLAPEDPIALEAYAFLEDYVVANYSGSSGEHVPGDVKAWLEELSRLILTATAEDPS